VMLLARDDALVKLLALGPETASAIVLATGWPAHETRALLCELVASGRLDECLYRCQHGRLYGVPGFAARAVPVCKMDSRLVHQPRPAPWPPAAQLTN
jgi:hypothetical protein